MNDERHHADDDMSLSSHELEQLAAFIDGTLEADDQRLVVDRLGTDEDYYEIFAELREVLDHDFSLEHSDPRELEEAKENPASEALQPLPSEDRKGPSAEGLPSEPNLPVREMKEEVTTGSTTKDPAQREYQLFRFPRKLIAAVPNSPASMFRLAAFLIVSVGGVLLGHQHFFSFDATYSRLLASVRSDGDGPSVPYNVPVNWFERGVGDPAELLDPKVAFRLGVLVLDLDLAMRDGDSEITADRLHTVRVEANNSIFGEYWGKPFEAIQTASEKDASKEELLEALEAARREATRDSIIDRDVLAVGTWARACHLAASSGQSRPVLRGRLAEPPKDLDAGWWPDLRKKHRQAMESGDLEAVAEACERILYKGTREW